MDGPGPVAHVVHIPTIDANQCDAHLDQGCGSIRGEIGIVREVLGALPPCIPAGTDEERASRPVQAREVGGIDGERSCRDATRDIERPVPGNSPVLSLDGTNYGLTPASPKWVATKSSEGFDPNAFTGASEQKYIGEESLPQGKAWHVTAKDNGGNAFDAYIRESDGYPIKYVETQSGGQNITLIFDKYNTGETITAPPADQIQPG